MPPRGKPQHQLRRVPAATAFATTTSAGKRLFGVQPKDVPTFAGAALILSAAALPASWLPARRAARIDPLSAIREER